MQAPGLDLPATRPFAIGLQETRILAPAVDFAADFAAGGVLYCRDIFEPPLFATVMRQLAMSEFVHDEVKGLGTREVEHPRRAGHTISLLLSNPALLHWMQELAGCEPLARAQGRVVQSRAGETHGLVWHNDTGMARRVAITIDLGTDGFTGGDFELREAATKRMVAVHHHEAPGSALLFAVDKRFEHRVLPVTAGGPRRVFAGWFFLPEAAPA